MSIISRLWMVLIVLVILAGFAGPTFGQTKTAFKVMSKGDMFMLDEVGAILVMKDGNLTIDMIMEPDQRPQEYRAVDLLKDDVVSMANGKRLKAVADMEETYTNLEIGGELKLGVKRGKEMRIVSLKKADPDKLPAKRVMTMTIGGDEAEGQDAEGAGMLKFDGAEGEMIPLLELGLLLATGDKGIIVLKVLPNSPDVFGSVAVKDGDLLATINGEPVADKAAFDKAFGSIKIGESMTLGFARGDEKFQAEVVKPEPASEITVER